MKFKTIELGGATYQIKLVDKVDELGSIDIDKKIIYVYKYAKKKQRVLFHESLHAFVETYLPQYQGELLVEQLESFLCKTIIQLKKGEKLYGFL